MRDIPECSTVNWFESSGKVNETDNAHLLVVPHLFQGSSLPGRNPIWPDSCRLFTLKYLLQDSCKQLGGNVETIYSTIVFLGVCRLLERGSRMSSHESWWRFADCQARAVILCISGAIILFDCFNGSTGSPSTPGALFVGRLLIE